MKVTVIDERGFWDLREDKPRAFKESFECDETRAAELVALGVCKKVEKCQPTQQQQN